MKSLLLWLAAAVSAYAVAALLLLPLGCGSSTPSKLRPEPTEAHPLIGCIGDNLTGPAQREAARKNRQHIMLPEVVTVIGTYEPDPSQWEILKKGYDRWVPYPKDRVYFDFCGDEVEAYRELQQPPASSIPPRTDSR